MTTVRSFVTASRRINSKLVRHEMFQGRDHLVVPIVALVEGVLQGANSPTPELALASEFGKVPAGWNGRPVTIGHPERNNSFVSASASPTIFEEEHIGFLFNTRLDEKKLKTEAWIDLAKVSTMSVKVQDAVARLEAEEIVEVSTGLFVDTEEETGRYNNKEYKAVWRNTTPDHLAILEKGVTGACSVADGCGSRLNSALKVDTHEHDDDHDCNCGGDCCDDKDKMTEQTPETKSFIKGLMQKAADIFKLKNQSETISDRDIRTALEAALSVEDAGVFYWITHTFDSYFIYSKEWSSDMLKRTYTISTDGTVGLGSEIEQVRPVTEFIPVKITTMEDNQMTKEQKVASLIANANTKFADGDKEWLTTLSEDQLDKLIPAEAEAPKPPVAPTTPPVTTPVTPTPATPAVPQTAAEYIENAPEGIKEVLANAMKANNERKDSLIAKLVANKSNEFSETELKGFSIESLERLNKLANVNFEGRGGSSISANAADESAAPVAPKAFSAKKA